MKIPFYQVDAFASRVFSGNPAGVCLLDRWIEDSRLLAIAAENNLSETAFLVRSGAGFDITWFTPVTEVALCGHATLASAYVVFNYLDWADDTVLFQTRKSGRLSVKRKGDRLEMDFPSRPPSRQQAPEGLDKALGGEIQDVLSSKEDLLVVLKDENEVRSLRPDLSVLERLVIRGTIVTAPGLQCDFVSRFFAPQVGIPEDPVTGSAHCVLIPYWARRLGKKRLHARQVSKRGGELFCEDCGERVKIAGRAAIYLEGALYV
jgi:PhzF family phenazine biosynthesis protein